MPVTIRYHYGINYFNTTFLILFILKNLNMKNAFLIISTLLIAGFVFFANCNGGDGEGLTAQQEQAKLLQGTWTVQSATVPQGVDPAILNGGTLTFNADQNYAPTTFSSSGMPDFFSTTGSSSWSFSGQSTTQVVLAGVTPVSDFTINSITSNTLSISFSHPGLGARIADLGGDYTASLTK